jgi:(p)ppGpp synthase/HD superfamily hydrolase
MLLVRVIVGILVVLGILIILMNFKKNTKTPGGSGFDEIVREASYLHRYQSYDKSPYTKHLSRVAEIARKYWDFYGNEPKLHEALWMAAWFHDTLEDVPSYSYNDLLRYATKFFQGDTMYAEMVANIVYACTTEKGKTRAERAGDKYYQGIRETGYAPFIKACDRLANMEYAYSVHSSMEKVYKKEIPEFLKKIENPDNPIPPELKKELCQYLQD